jgi:hypothetical protein
MKGFTFYRAGSRGNEPLEAVDISTINLDKMIQEGKLEEQVEGIDTCIDGACEL